MKPIRITSKWKVNSWNTKKLFADDDRDGVANVFDCQPHNRRKQDGEWGNAELNEKKFERLDSSKGDKILSDLSKSSRFRKATRRY